MKKLVIVSFGGSDNYLYEFKFNSPLMSRTEQEKLVVDYLKLKQDFNSFHDTILFIDKPIKVKL